MEPFVAHGLPRTAKWNLLLLRDDCGPGDGIWMLPVPVCSVTGGTRDDEDHASTSSAATSGSAASSAFS